MGLVPVAVLVVVMVFEATAVVVARASAVRAADLAALAAVAAIAGDGRAPGPVDGAVARSAAATVAAANGASLVACSCDVLPVAVTVRVGVPSPFGLRPSATVGATSRATLVAERARPRTARTLPSPSTTSTTGSSP